MVTEINITLIHKINVSLQSRQKKGGQSAVRIARIAEEKRFIYLKQVIEKLNSIYVDKVKSLIIAGPAEMKSLLYQSDLVDYRLKNLMTKMTVDTITDETIYQINIKTNDNLCQDLIEGINNGQYIYGHEEIQKYLDYKNCDKLYIHHSIKHDYNHYIIIKSDDAYSKIICQYGGVVLIPYYIIEEI